MSIASFSFLFFLLAVVIVYYLLPFSYWRRGILLIAGLAFYASFHVYDLYYLLTVIFYSYVMSFFLEEKQSKLCLAVSVFPVMLGLCFYKYAEILTGNQSISLAAPLGISFFTFKVISYLCDIHQKKYTAERSLMKYALYGSFFPQISSGPIQRADSFFAALDLTKKMNVEMMRHGFLLMVFGYFEKMVIADRLYLIVDRVFSNASSWTPSMVLIGCLAYSFQIYADFDAYSNLAVGMGELFGISCGRNFHAPYLAKNIKEFWNRWHISLSTWLRDYVYLPLGGSRKGYFRKIFNIMAVFLISGLWHGTAWNYLLWGLMNGLFRVLYDVLHQFVFLKIHIRFKLLIWFFSCLGIIINFALVTCLWVFFRSSSLSEIQTVFSLLSQFDYTMFEFSIPDTEMSELMVTALMTLMLIAADVLRNMGFTMHHFGKLFFPLRWCVYLVMLILGIVFAVYGTGYDPSKFIYIQF